MGDKFKTAGDEVAKRMMDALERIGGKPGKCEITPDSVILNPRKVRETAVRDAEKPIFSSKLGYDLLYIKDHYFKRNKRQHDKEVAAHPNRCYVPGNKIHVYWCKTLQGQEPQAVDARYRGEPKTKGDVRLIDLQDAENVETRLAWCKNCIKILLKNFAWSWYSYDKNDIAEYADAVEIFQCVETLYNAPGKQTKENAERILVPISHLPTNRFRGSAPSSSYGPGWKKISAKFRQSRNYTCEKCGVNCTTNIGLSHVHHRDRDKSNCLYHNLQCLCVFCHSKMESHGHMRVKDGDMEKLRQLWKEQNIPEEKRG